MADHALLLVPLCKDLRNDLYDPDNPKYLGTQAEAEARSRGDDFTVEDDVFFVRNEAELKKTLPKLREYKYLTLDIHGDPPLNGSEEPSGEVCVAASDEPEKFVSLPPRDLNLRSGKPELLVVASCHQREVMLNCAVPRGCRVISYSNVLKEGSVNGLVRHASHAKDFLDIELSTAAVDEISRRVKGLSRNSKTLEDWLMFESE